MGGGGKFEGIIVGELGCLEFGISQCKKIVHFASAVTLPSCYMYYFIVKKHHDYSAFCCSLKHMNSDSDKEKFNSGENLIRIRV